MTLFKSTDGLVAGQPISPFFGAQNGVQGAGAPVIQTPAASPNSGVQAPILDSVSRGSIPHNALVASVNGVNVGGPVGAIGGDPCSVMELLSSGNGNQANGGVGPGSNVNVPQQGEAQEYAVGLTAVAMTEDGPTPVNVDTLGLAPTSGGLPANQLGLVAQGFEG